MDEELLKLRDTILPEVVQGLEKKFPYAFGWAMRRRGFEAVISKSTSINDGSGHFIPANVDGVVLRVFDGKSIHEAYTHEFSAEAIAKIARQLEELPAYDASVDIFPGQKLTETYCSKFDIDPDSVPLDDKLSVLKALKSKAESQPGIGSAMVQFRYFPTQEVFVNRNKRLAQDLRYARAAIRMGAKDDPKEYYFILNGGSGFEVTQIPLNDIPYLASRVSILPQAIAQKPTHKLDVIIDPLYAGLIAHESAGHGLEGDTASCLIAKGRKHVGEQIGSELVTLFADPTLPGFGQYFFDHEGHLAQRVTLIDKGVITGDYMTDEQSALFAGFSTNGHGRRESPFSTVYSRQSYTGFAPLSAEQGGVTREEMIASIDDGILIEGGFGGMEDPHGWTIQANGRYGLEIKSGKLTGRIYSDIKLDGTVPELLQAVSAVGVSETIRPGYCGKYSKEYLRVGSGGPHLLLRNVKVA